MPTLLVPHADSSAADVRQVLTRALRRQDVPEPVLDDALLVMTELIGNAVRHGDPLTGGVVRVSWWVAGGSVHLEVCDGGPGLPGEVGEVRLGARLRDAEGDLPLAEEGGRGLPIVDLLSARWGTTAPGPTGVVAVYAELPLDAGPTARLSRGGRTVDAPDVGPWARRRSAAV